MDVVGVDVGTMNLLSAKQLKDNKVQVKTMRNMFLPVSPEDLSASELSNTQLDYAEAKDEDGEVENIFRQKVKRPMLSGVKSSSEIDAIDVLTLMMEKLIGRTKSGYCVYSIPAQ